MINCLIILGKQNYGPSFEKMPTGIVGGPVKLIDSNGTAIDLSNSSWSYKVTHYFSSMLSCLLTAGIDHIVFLALMFFCDVGWLG